MDFDQRFQSTQEIKIPKVVIWFKIYCIFMTLFMLANAAGVFYLLVINYNVMAELNLFIVVIGIFVTLIAVLFMVFWSLPLFIAPKPRVWTYGTVSICIGLIIPVFIPFCLPLLIFWLKPATKKYFQTTSENQRITKTVATKVHITFIMLLLILICFEFIIYTKLQLGTSLGHRIGAALGQIVIWGLMYFICVRFAQKTLALVLNAFVFLISLINPMIGYAWILFLAICAIVERNTKRNSQKGL